MEKYSKEFEIIEASGSFLVMEHKNSEPFLTNNIERASRYPVLGDWEDKSVAKNVIELIKEKGYTMPLKIKQLRLDFTISD